MASRFSALLLASLVAAGCATSVDATTVSFADSQAPVANAQVIPLAGNRGPDGGVDILAVDPNNGSVATNDAGQFEIDYGTVPAVAGVQITIDVPSEVSDAVGQIEWRAVLDDPGAQGVELEIPELVSCSAGADCGTPLLPDLSPVIGWDDVEPSVAEFLRPGTVGPPSAGLFPAETWFVEQDGDRRLLRFATVAANLGEGPLDIIALPGEGETSQTWQRVWTSNWNFHDSLSGEFIFHEEHDHVHFDAFERYTLRDTSGAVVAESEKVSFCLRDSVRLIEDRPPAEGLMLVDDGSCEGQQQVINPGFGDHYHALLEDQWIDITGVPAGSYEVEIVVDPLDLIIESNEDNNVGSFRVVIEP